MANTNTGDCSTGDYSTGDYSTGDCSTGYYSTGYCSTGNRSTGNRSTGNCSISKFSSGHFSTIDYSGYGWFNKPCNKMWDEVDTPNFTDFEIAYWISVENMTKEEKKENPTYKTTGGFLKSVDYKTAWKLFWRKTSEENKKKFLNLPNFDWDIFTEITGVEREEQAQEMTMEEVCKELGRTIKIKK